MTGASTDGVLPAKPRVRGPARGSPASSHILKSIARKLKDQSREYDVLARTDADEFILVLPEFPVKYLEGRIARLEQGDAAAAAEVIGDRLTFTFATSYANCPEDGDDAESLLALSATRLHDLREERTAEASAG